MSVWQEVRNKKPKSGCLFGIELEIEGINISDVDSDDLPSRCTVVEDHSLRNGIEIVTEPLTQLDVVQFANEYQQYVGSQGATLSQRCSTHIHVNVSDLTAEQTLAFMWLAVAIEPVLMSTVSEYRQHNTYCYPVYNTTNMVNTIRRMVFNPRLFVSNNSPKYSAIGLYRYRDYGTVEFRMFDGTLSAQDIITWTTLLGELRHKAINTTVDRLIEDKTRDGLQSLLVSYLTLTSNNVEELLELGVEMANNILFKKMTADDILNFHAELFPEEAPLRIVKGQFGSACMAAENLQEFLSNYSADQFTSVYGDTGLFDLFIENNHNPVRSAEIVQAVRNQFGL